MERSLFGPRFQEAQDLLAGVTDPVALIELTSHVSRAIYESAHEGGWTADRYQQWLSRTLVEALVDSQS